MKKHAPKWKRITALAALDLIRDLERERSNENRLWAYDRAIVALDSHVRAELSRRRR